MRSETKPRYHHGALEQALVDEAVRQVRERGAEHVSLRGLAQTIGVSPSAAYQHFPDKAALLYAVCGSGFTELTRRMTEAIDAVTAEGDAGAIGRFLAVGRVYLDFAVTETHLFRHMFSASSAKGSQFTHPEDYLDVRWEPGDDPHDLLLARTGELADAGRTVVLVDQESEANLGGQAFWSFGGLFLVDSPEQRRMGVRDGAALAWQDWLGTAGFDRLDGKHPADLWPRRWARAYIEFAAGEKRSWR